MLQQHLNFKPKKRLFLAPFENVAFVEGNPIGTGSLKPGNLRPEKYILDMAISHLRTAFLQNRLYLTLNKVCSGLKTDPGGLLKRKLCPDCPQHVQIQN